MMKNKNFNSDEVEFRKSESQKIKKKNDDERLQRDTQKRVNQEKKVAQKNRIEQSRKNKKTELEKLDEQSRREKIRKDKEHIREASRNNQRSLIKTKINVWKDLRSQHRGLSKRTFHITHIKRKSGGFEKNVFLGSSRRTKKAFVSVRSSFYKGGAAWGLFKHVSREISTYYDCRNTASVVPEFIQNNRSYSFKGLKECDQEYQEATGKKPRSDFRKVYEHVVVFSEDQFIELERQFGEEAAKEMLLEHLKLYALEIQNEFGFEPMRVDLHLDEGYVNERTGQFHRNVHCHIQFYNYDFVNKISPLKGVMKKVKCPSTGKLEANPAPAKFQDIAADTFKKLGFKRGEKKDKTKKSHIARDQYIAQQQKKREEKIATLDASLKEREEKIKAQAEQYRTKLREERSAIDNDLNTLHEQQHQHQQSLEQFNEVLALMNKIRTWKKQVMEQDFDLATKSRKQIEAKYEELTSTKQSLSPEMSKNLNEILDYEFTQAAEFEEDYYVLEEERISSKHKRRKSVKL